MQSKTRRSVVIAASVLAVTALVLTSFLLTDSSEPTPTAVEPGITNTAQVLTAETVAPTAAAVDRAAASDDGDERIVLAQADPAPASGRFQLGTHYERLPAAQGTSSSPDLVEVAEVFWYGCPHCYTFDPYLENWREDLPEDVSFVRIPAVWNALLQIHARAFYAAEALGVSDELHAPIFREIHINRNGLDSQGALADFFVAHGVEAGAFDAAFESFSVNTKMNRADELSRRYRIASVPKVVINGKYTTDAGMAGSYEELMELIDELVAMERAGQ